MKYFLLLILIFAKHADACEVTLPNQMLIFNEDLIDKSIYQSSNCESKLIDDLHQTVTGLEGRIASFQLKELMSIKGHSLEINPPSILIKQLKTLIREQLKMPSGVQVKAAHSQNLPGIIALPAGDKVEISCFSCLFGTQEPIHIIISGIDGSKKTIIASVDFKKLVKAYRLISPLTSFSLLDDVSILKEEYLEAIPHTDLITDRNLLKFYKTNKPLRAGELLKKSDLNAVNLVRAGLKTDVVLENKMVRIKTSGISRSNGSIGEMVEVFHPQKNKKYLGKVVDINKVLVEL